MTVPPLVGYTILKARSTRVPGKNFRDLGGRPLFRWMTDTLLSLPELQVLAIDTDADRELRSAGLPQDPRLVLLDRPEELRGDDVTADPLVAWDLPRLPEGLILMAHVTSPFLSAPTIRQAVEAFLEGRSRGRCDSLVSVTRRQTRFWTADGHPLNHDPRNLLPTQDLEPWFEENSALYLFTRESFQAASSRVGLRPLLFPLPPLEGLDIDTEEDWHLAEAVARGLGGRPETEA